LEQTGRYYFCLECQDREWWNKDGSYIYPGVSRILSFWNKKQEPYPGNWMEQPKGFGALISICNEEQAKYQQEQAKKAK